METFRNFELGLAGQVLCTNEKEALKLAESFFGCEPRMLVEGRKDFKKESGLIVEYFDRHDGTQENPFFCIIQKQKRLIPNMKSIVDKQFYSEIKTLLSE